MADSFVPMCWAGRDYPVEDKYTTLFDTAVQAYRKVDDIGSSQYCAGLLHAYALVTGDAYHAVWEQVAKAAREPVAS